MAVESVGSGAISTQSMLKFLRELRPGERLKFLGDGRCLIVHPDRPPRVLTLEELKEGEGSDGRVCDPSTPG